MDEMRLDFAERCEGLRFWTDECVDTLGEVVVADGTTMLGGVGLDTTVMAAPSLRKRGYTCLSADDIDGLQHAYPHCGRPHHGTPICIEVKRFTWAFRALVVVGGRGAGG